MTSASPGDKLSELGPTCPHHHLHVVIAGSQPHLDHVLLRQHLRRHPAAVAEYAALKKDLVPLLREDRQAYLDAESELVQRLLASDRARRRTHRS